MYNKVETNMNFVDREKADREVLGRSMTSSKKVMEQRKQGARPTHSMTDLRLQTENHISDTY